MHRESCITTTITCILRLLAIGLIIMHSAMVKNVPSTPPLCLVAAWCRGSCCPRGQKQSIWGLKIELSQCGQIHKFTWKSTPNGKHNNLLKPDIRTSFQHCCHQMLVITVVNEIRTNSWALMCYDENKWQNSNCVFRELKHHWNLFENYGISSWKIHNLCLHPTAKLETNLATLSYRLKFCSLVDDY